MAGQTSTRKLKELVLYLCERSETDETFGKVKLNKLAFYCDFQSYLTTGKPITGQTYRKQPEGPCPVRMVTVLNELIRSRHLHIAERNFLGKTQKKPIALRSASRTAFTEHEIELIEGVIKQWWGKTATAISASTHGHMWNMAQMKEDIPYAAVLFTNERPLTDEIRDYAMTLERPDEAAS